MPYNVPNLLTMLRLVLIPVFVLVYYLPYAWSHAASAGVFALAAVTDWLDGYLARRLDQTSAFGAFLDPVVDKLMVAVALVLLVQTHPTKLFAIPAAVIVGREIAISALREWMAGIGGRAKVAVSIIGKIKTTAQMLALLLLLWHNPAGPFPTSDVGSGAALYRRGADAVVDGDLPACGLADAGPRRASRCPEFLCTAALDTQGAAITITFLVRSAGIAQLVEHNLAKVGVASSSLVSRSKKAVNLGRAAEVFSARRATHSSSGPNGMTVR